MVVIFQIILFLFPRKCRIYLLNHFLGWEIDLSAKLGLSLLNVKYVKIGENGVIGSFNLIRNVSSLYLGSHARLGSLNYVTGYPENGVKHFVNQVRKPELHIGNHAAITSRHYIDCTDKVSIGDFTTVAGIRSQILTHSINIFTNRQEAAPVEIGKNCFIGTSCVILKGVYIADKVIVGASSCVNKSITEMYTLHGGVPCRFIKYLAATEVKYFLRLKGFVD